MKIINFNSINLKSIYLNNRIIVGLILCLILFIYFYCNRTISGGNKKNIRETLLKLKDRILNKKVEAEETEIDTEMYETPEDDINDDINDEDEDTLIENKIKGNMIDNVSIKNVNLNKKFSIGNVVHISIDNSIGIIQNNNIQNKEEYTVKKMNENMVYNVKEDKLKLLAENIDIYNKNKETQYINSMVKPLKNDLIDFIIDPNWLNLNETINNNNIMNIINEKTSLIDIKEYIYDNIYTYINIDNIDDYKNKLNNIDKNVSEQMNLLMKKNMKAEIIDSIPLKMFKKKYIKINDINQIDVTYNYDLYIKELYKLYKSINVIQKHQKFTLNNNVCDNISNVLYNEKTKMCNIPNSLIKKALIKKAQTELRDINKEQEELNNKMDSAKETLKYAEDDFLMGGGNYYYIN